jgi:hypothetical protein
MGKIDHLHQSKDEGQPGGNNHIHQPQGQPVQKLFECYLDRHLWKDLVKDKPYQTSAYTCQYHCIEEKPAASLIVHL